MTANIIFVIRPMTVAGQEIIICVLSKDFSSERCKMHVNKRTDPYLALRSTRNRQQKWYHFSQ